MSITKIITNHSSDNLRMRLRKLYSALSGLMNNDGIVYTRAISPGWCIPRFQRLGATSRAEVNGIWK